MLVYSSLEMKIGFDGKRAAQNFTGLGNYSRYALEAMARCFPNEEYRVYTPKKSAMRGLMLLSTLRMGLCVLCCHQKSGPGN